VVLLTVPLNSISSSYLASYNVHVMVMITMTRLLQIWYGILAILYVVGLFPPSFMIVPLYSELITE
jgi:spore maturation protein SpmA